MIDILFIHPNASHKIYQGLADNHSAIEPPIWAGLLCGHCLQNGYSAEILDCEHDQLYPDEVPEIVSVYNPHVVCVVVYGQQPSASTQNMEGAVALADKIKKDNPNQFIVFVGGHIAALPDEVLELHPSIDATCQNEGVYTLSNLINCVKNNENLGNVLGLCYRLNDHVYINEPQKIVPQERMEEDLPDIIKRYIGYRTAGWHSWTNSSEKSPFAALYTSIGCPMKCSFCCINTINGCKKGVGQSHFRYWKPEHTIKHFDYFAEHNIKNIKIADELFVLKKEHFLKLCNLIIERRYDFNIWCYCRIGTCYPH